ncbi:hypothetical protein B0T16DRAFT_424666 [Cercophora newfieldiana]|uniref:Roadblock/LAMTOR2 domain-containing protein n=1 Tax=Cercophora newfieldiana TaxID=92897 RepID=A0AA39YNV2_9PEZI|nr:hypothetical protein B0T16DRAFT_424666 [Cercophora newfieldiana]
MSDPVLSTGPDALEETLGRLSKKPGVKATIVLDRASGAILKTSGQVSAVRKINSTSSSLPTQTTGSFSSDAATNTTAGPSTQEQGFQELAAIVWNFIGTAGGLVQQLDTEDELKLLRLRTKKQELVIVPDVKYLLIVVHDTPPA